MEIPIILNDLSNDNVMYNATKNHGQYMYNYFIVYINEPWIF